MSGCLVFCGIDIGGLGFTKQGRTVPKSFRGLPSCMARLFRSCLSAATDLVTIGVSLPSVASFLEARSDSTVPFLLVGVNSLLVIFLLVRMY